MEGLSKESPKRVEQKSEGLPSVFLFIKPNCVFFFFSGLTKEMVDWKRSRERPGKLLAKEVCRIESLDKSYLFFEMVASTWELDLRFRNEM